MTPMTRRATAVALLFSALCAISASAGSATVEFRLNRSFSKGKHLPAFVVWVETTDGEYVTTLRMGSAAKAQDGLKAKGKPADYFKMWDQAHMDVVAVDAVTKATPWPGKSVKISWDLKSAKGDEVPKGEYVLKIESAIEGPDNKKFGQVIAMRFKVGSRKTRYSRSKTTHQDGRTTSKRITYVQKLSVRISKE